MPSKIKQRSQTGLTNTKSLSKSNVSISNKSASTKKCVCRTCTCGQHICQQKNKTISNTVSGTKVPLDGKSVTKDDYKEHEIPERKLVKQEHKFLPKANLDDETETKSKFVPLAVPPPPQRRVQKYEKNDARLDGTSETKTQFVPREIPERKNFKPEVQLPPKREIETTTESNQQYTPKPVPPRPQPHIQKIVKNDALLEGVSETKTQFVPRELPELKSFKPEAQPPPKRNLEGTTESSDQFIPRPVPPRPQRRVQKYEPNPNNLEGVSELKEAYKEWPNQGRPQKFKKMTYKSNGLKLEGDSVTHSDYMPIENQERVLPTKAVSQYTPPTGPLDTKSLYHEEFQPHTDLHPPKKHEREVLKREKEDRDFKSVTQTTYLPVDSKDIHVPVKHKQQYNPSNLKLEGESVLHSDYYAHDLNLIERKDIKLAALRDRQGTYKKDASNITDETEYRKQYLTVKVQDRVQAIRPAVNSSVAGAKAPLEGGSEQRYSYKRPDELSPKGMGVYKMADSFKPANTKKTGAEDRNFQTETKDGFDPAKLTVCPASLKSSCNKHVGGDGHVYFDESLDALSK